MPKKNPELTNATAQQVIVLRMAPRILQFLANQSGKIEEKAIAKGVVGKNEYIALTLAWLVQHHRLVISGSGVRSDPYRYGLPENRNSKHGVYANQASIETEDEVELTI